MPQTYSVNNAKTLGFVKGATIGAVLGALAGVFGNISVILGAILGIVIGGITGSLTKLGNDPMEEAPEYDEDAAHLQLLEERLNISKELVRTGEVKVRKEVLTEDKTITIPINREELVIEKKVFKDTNASEAPVETETIRIPISEERIEIAKHRVDLEDVSIYKHRFEETQLVEETLRKEKLHVEQTGDIKVTEVDSKEN